MAVKIARIDLFPYSLELASPVETGSVRWNRKDGILVRVTALSGVEGWGDCAPLPGVSRETCAEAGDAVAAIADALLHAEIANVADLRALSRRWAQIPSSARAGLEGAIICAAAAEEGVSPAKWIFGRDARVCEINALVAGPPATWADQCAHALSNGFRRAKIKVARYALEEELAGLEAVRRAAPELSIRLDANRRWTPVEASRFAQEALARGLSFEYLEEPCDPLAIGHEQWPGGVPVALDESFWNGGEPSVYPWPVTAWVLKPTLIGGLLRALDLAARATKEGCAVTWSSAYESGVGLRILAELAGAMETVAGLDTFREQATDVLYPPLELACGQINLEKARASRVRFDRRSPPS